MLKQFNFRNFLCFLEDEGRTVELSMMAGRAKNHADHFFMTEEGKLLPAAVVFGANGAGKSALLRAMEFMRRCVLEGMPADA